MNESTENPENYGREARTWVVHPLLLALVPIVSLYARNVHEIPPRQLIGPVLTACLLVMPAWLIVRVLLRDGRKAGLIASLAVVFFYTVVRLDEIVDSLFQDYWVTRDQPYRAPAGLLVGGEVALFLVLGGLVLSRRKPLTGVTSFFNMFATILVILPLGEAIWSRFSEPIGETSRAPAFVEGLAPGPRPDIYYIILDAYARSDVMKELFHFDNGPFLDRLEKRGFFVARRSTANYAQTPLCLSSSLNGTYLDDLVHGLVNDQTALSGLIGDSAIVKTLRPLGYKFVTFSTGFDPTEHPEADVYLSPFRPYAGFHRMLIDRTPLHSLMPDPKERDSFTMARERILFALNTLPDVAKDRAPTFTFAHILAPHPPFLFGEAGEDVSPRDRGYFISDGERFRIMAGGVGEEYARGYRAQAVFVTKRIEETIDRILKSSPEPPIIILQSDHGSGLRLDMQSIANTDLHERMSILNAYYFPGGQYEKLNDRITPVNSFRAMFNSCFGTKLPLLPDQSFFSTWSQPYRFLDVTNKVRSPADGASEGG